MNKISKIIICVVSCLAIGYVSGKVTQSSLLTWYPLLKKPSFNPPNWAFPLAWTTLFIFMGTAAGIIWSKINNKKSEVEKALTFFIIQLALNALWSILFFGLQNPFLALIEIVLLWLLIYETYSKFIRIDKTAANLLIPYLLWVGFAIILNANIWWLNR
jgi:translocator protein